MLKMPIVYFFIDHLIYWVDSTEIRTSPKQVASCLFPPFFPAAWAEGGAVAVAVVVAVAVARSRFVESAEMKWLSTRASRENEDKLLIGILLMEIRAGRGGACTHQTPGD